MKTKDKNMITEELLAAFEEGKTNAEETALVLEYLATDESKRNLSCLNSWMP